MTRLFKLSTLFFLMVHLSLTTNAQVKLKKPDVIEKIDKTSLEVVIDEINKTEILYRKAADPKGPLYGLPKKEVRRIIWNNGDVEDITIPIAASTVAEKPKAPASTEKPQAPWDQKGAFYGLKVGAGIGSVSTPHTTALAQGARLAYNAGGLLGYRSKSFAVQMEALYTGISFDILTNDNRQSIKSVGGRQNNIVLPITLSLFTRLSKVKVGLSAGGFASMQLGKGTTQITTTENTVTNVRNCAECGDKAIFGVTGGLTAFLIERPSHAVFLDLKYYHTLGDNAQYRVAENGVKTNNLLLGIGVLVNLAR